jgi:hypothetical protein
VDETAAGGATGAGPGTVLLGAALVAAGAGWRATRPLRALSAGVARQVAATAAAVAPETTANLVRRGQVGLAELDAAVDVVLGFVIRRVVAALVAAVDLTALVRESVDLDAVAAGLDVDKVVARVDIDTIVRRVDLDGVAAGLDVDAVVARVDIDAIVRRVDLDGVAAGLDVDAVVARVDLDAIVDRMDIIGIAREVVDGIDLPEIIRHSTGALTSDSVRTVRTEARNADDVVAGVVDRLLRRARTTRTPAP